jgi:AcrR family transcriptional regulator
VSRLHDRPDKDELLAAVVEFLRDLDVPEEQRYHLRVAVNVLEIVRRELTLGPDQERAHREQLAALGVADDAELASRLRSGESSPATVRDAVLESVVDKLRVANPRYLEES